MLDEGDNWGIDPLEFISRVNSSFDKHMKIDRRTKKVLFHAWMNGNWNKRRIDNSILSSNSTTSYSFFKPYLTYVERATPKRKMNKVRQSANIAIHLALLMSNLTREGAKQKSLKLFITHLDPTKNILLLEGPRERNIDEVGGMHIFWNSMCVLFMLGFRRFSST
ncbi:hypothetical protein Tco_0020818 [Tanacetum coccineum]